MKPLESKIQGNPVCSWCAPPSTQSPLPNAFCWTRMQAEAGQPLNAIIKRKELERSIGNGVFYWGVGNALGGSLRALINCAPQPEVFFSVMRSKPKRVDSSPGTVLLWTHFVDQNGGLQPLPQHTIVLSRGDTASGKEKRCYALVCHSDIALCLSSIAHFNLSHFRNLGEVGGKVGFSQVTVNIKHLSKESHGPMYEINLRSWLKPPYFVRLASPKRLLTEDRDAIAATVGSCPSSTKWQEFTEYIRTRREYASGNSQLLML
jgi:hypothetical protein